MISIMIIPTIFINIYIYIYIYIFISKLLCKYNNYENIKCIPNFAIYLKP